MAKSIDLSKSPEEFLIAHYSLTKKLDLTKDDVVFWKAGAVPLNRNERLRFGVNDSIGAIYIRRYVGMKRWLYTRTNLTPLLEGVTVKASKPAVSTHDLVEDVNEQVGMQLLPRHIRYAPIEETDTKVFVEMAGNNAGYTGGVWVELQAGSVEPEPGEDKELGQTLKNLALNAFTAEDLMHE